MSPLPGRGRGATNRNRSKPAAPRQVPLPSAAIGRTHLCSLAGRQQQVAPSDALSSERGHLTKTQKSDPAAKVTQVLQHYPPKATEMRVAARLRDGPQPDSCGVANSHLFDHLVGGSEQRRWDCQGEHSCSLEIDDQSNLVGCKTGNSAGLAPPKILPL